MEKNFPNLRCLQKLLYKGTRITWAKNKKGKEKDGYIIRGFVVNHNGTDVQTFELDKSNLNVILVSRTQSKLDSVAAEIIGKYPKGKYI